MNTTRNEIKARIVGTGLTMQETLDRLDEMGFIAEIKASLRYREAVELADVIGYELKWVPRKRGDADDECRH